jgi:hypothetical protein
MPLDIANTVLASAPYYDDFDEDKKYHRILFRPSVPLQARELNQAQSILQNQIERFGDYVVQSGSIVKSDGSLETIPAAKFISVADNSDTENANYVGATIVGANTGVEAVILTGIDGYFASSRPSKFFIIYTKSGRDAAGNTVYTFQAGINGDPGETLQIYGDTNLYKGQTVVTVSASVSNSDFASGGGYALGTEFFGGTSSATGKVYYGEASTKTIILEDVRGSFVSGETIYSKANTQISTTLTSVGSALLEDTGSLIGTSRMLSPNTALNYEATGSAYCVRVPEAIVYQKGFFIKTEDQVLVVNSTSGGAISAAGQVVGYETEELIVTEYADNTLYDNAGGFSNEAAPGAHRLQLQTSLVAYVKDDIPTDTNFFPIAEFGPTGVLYIKDDAQFGAIGRTIAARTYEESGHYAVNAFNVRTETNDKSKLLVEDGKTRLGDFKYIISDGLAYVGGNRVETLSESQLVVDRATETLSDTQQLLTTTFGDYIYVDQIRGYFPSSGFASVTLYDDASKAVTSNFNIASSSPVGSAIGTANIRDIVYDSGVKGSPTGRYKLYLIDIKLNAGKSLRQVKSVYYTSGGVKAFADVATDPVLKSVKTINTTPVNGGTGYVIGDIVAVVGGNGNPAYVQIDAITGNGVASTVSLYDVGSYVAAPSGTVSTSYDGVGTGLTVGITAIENKPLNNLQETEYSKAVFPLSRRAIKNLRDADGAAETTYYYTAEAVGNVATTGIANFDFALSNTILGWTDASDLSELKIDLIVTGSANIETTSLTGTVSATTSTTVTGSGGTSFLNDFQIGEVIKQGANSAVIVSVVDNDTLIVGSAITFSGAYSRIHPRGSVISLGTSTRDITNINVNDGSFSVDLGSATTASIQTTARVLLKKTNSSALKKDVTRNVKVRLYEGQLSGKINGSTTTITEGDGLTKFQRELNVGDIIQVSNSSTSEIRSITAIASNTSLTVNAAFNTALVNASSNVVYSVVNPTGIWSLGFPDVIKVNSIRQSTGISESTDVGPDMSKNFVIDFGQRDTYYDHATLRLKNNSSFNMNEKPLIVDMDVLTVNSNINSGYFTVESYPIDDSDTNASATIKTWEIPGYYSTTAGKNIDLRDVIDFRPVKTKTANLTITANTATVNPIYEPTTVGGVTEFTNLTSSQKPFPGYNLQHNITYYLPRKDLVVISNKGNIEVIKGAAGINPKFDESYDSKYIMPIAKVNVPAYPSLTIPEVITSGRKDYAITINNIDNRRFTMKDIAAIEQRVSTLEYTTVLSMLEKSVLSTPIIGEDGTDRFKNGFFVDGFDNTAYVDYKTGHNLVIDEIQGVGRSPYSLEYVDLEMSRPYAANASITNDEFSDIAWNKDFVTISYNQEIIMQHASASKGLFVDSTINYNGTIELSPNRFFDVEETTKYPIPSESTSAGDTYYTGTNQNNTIATNATSYPPDRTTKFIARGLLPNSRHWISIGQRDISDKAVQGRIDSATKIVENVVVDGLLGNPIYSNAEGVIYGIVNIPGNVPIGTHALNVTGKHINELDQFSTASGSFIVGKATILPPPLPPPPPPPSPPPSDSLVADFDVEGALSIDESKQFHTLTFIDKTNRSIPDGFVAIAPETYEWTFIVNGTSCVTASKLTSDTAGPHTIDYTIPTKGETFTVKLKVTNATLNRVSEYSKQITLARHASSTNPVKLTVYRHVPGDNNNYNLPEIGAIVKPSDGVIHLDFNSSRTTGNATFITLSSTTLTGGITNSAAWFSYSGVGVTFQEPDCTKENQGNSRLSVKWGTSGTALPGVLRVDVRYQGNNDIKLTRFINFSDTTDPNTICTPIPSGIISDNPGDAGSIGSPGIITDSLGGSGSGTTFVYEISPIITVMDNQIYSGGLAQIGAPTAANPGTLDDAQSEFEEWLNSRSEQF